MMAVVVAVLITGLLIGSFLNVCIYRIPRKESLLFPASHCPSCRTRLKWHHLIPLVSYLFQKGKCKYCGGGISPRYPLVEAANAALWLLIFWRWGLSVAFAKYALLSSLLLVITLIDLEHLMIPDGLNVFGSLAGGIFFLVPGADVSWLEGALGLLTGGGIFLLIALLSRGGMGGGDIKLMGMLGLWLGWQHILLVTFFSFILGAIVALALLAVKRKSRKDALPFGPFLALAAYIVLLYGGSLLTFYWGCLG